MNEEKIVKKILSVVLAASMIFGNVGLPQELKEVHAVQTDIGSIISGKTLVTDSEIQNLYREMSYTPQGVHDPSIIKKDNEWYVFGSHRAVAKTDDLQNWQTVNMNGLFGDKDGTILTPDEAFVNSLYKGTIQTSKMAQTFMKNIKDDKTKETEETKTEQITVESEETFEIETESEQETETESESKTESERETETVSESETTSGKISENETASEIEKEAEDGTVVETGNFCMEKSEQKKFLRKMTQRI